LSFHLQDKVKDVINCIKLSYVVFQKAYRQYESAMGSAAGMGDRLCQMEAMDGVARCLEALRLQQKICNCRPLEFNTRLLEVASSIGAKVLHFGVLKEESCFQK
jgi:hypothetical protein